MLDADHRLVGRRACPMQVTLTAYPTSNLFCRGTGSGVFHERGREPRVVVPIIAVGSGVQRL